jgi:hypothetical protein
MLSRILQTPLKGPQVRSWYGHVQDRFLCRLGATKVIQLLSEAPSGALTIRPELPASSALMEMEEQMPRYYFDMRDADGVVPDAEGLELGAMKAVQPEAAQALAYMARDAIGEYPNGPLGPMAIEVRDDNGPVLEVKFQFSIGPTLKT